MRGPKSGLKKGAWSVEEDQKLFAYIKRYGIWNWNQIPKHAGEIDVYMNNILVHVIDPFN